MSSASPVTLACILTLATLAVVPHGAAALPPSGAVASLYEHFAGGGWEIDVFAPDCDSDVQELDGAYDNSLSWVAFGPDGWACQIVLYDGHGGTGASIICAPPVSVKCDFALLEFNDVASSYQVVPAAPCLGVPPQVDGHGDCHTAEPCSPGVGVVVDGGGDCHTVEQCSGSTGVVVDGSPQCQNVSGGVVASLYEHFAGGGWEIDVFAPDCDSDVQELDGAYDNSLSWVAFGPDGWACQIVLYDGHGGTGASVLCAPPVSVKCDFALLEFNDVASSYQVVPAAPPCPPPGAGVPPQVDGHGDCHTIEQCPSDAGVVVDGSSYCPTGLKSCSAYNEIYASPYPGQDAGVVLEGNPAGTDGDTAACAGTAPAGRCDASQPGILVNNGPVCVPPQPVPCEIPSLGVENYGGCHTVGACDPPATVGATVDSSGGCIPPPCNPFPGQGWTAGVEGVCIGLPWVAVGGASPCPDSALVNVRLDYGIIPGSFDVCL